MNTTLLKTQVIASLKESNLDEDIMAYILGRDTGMKYEEALTLAESIAKSRKFQRMKNNGFLLNTKRRIKL